MKEKWKDIEGFEGLYQISNLGRIKTIKKGKILRTYIRKIKKRDTLSMCSLI